jgi:hypothetical protein
MAKSIKDTCIEFLKNEDTKREIKDIVKPLFNFIYNEIYIYLLLICIYHVFFFFIVLVNLYLLLKLLYKNNKYNWFDLAKSTSKLKYIHIIYL